MANDIFVDTSGFYALLVKADDRHAAASALLGPARKCRRRFVTTDYVLDETATLLKARGYSHLLNAFFDLLDQSHACRVEWTDPDEFHATRRFFLKHADQAWSFTDCLSFRIMKDLRLRDALTKDGHFQDAGFVVLLK
jgi:predicted nucleic acid-binding protein